MFCISPLQYIPCGLPLLNSWKVECSEMLKFSKVLLLKFSKVLLLKFSKVSLGKKESVTRGGNFINRRIPQGICE